MKIWNSINSTLRNNSAALALFAVAACLAPTAAGAKPFIFYRGVIHAASFAPPGSPAGAIPQGGMFSIFGREMGPAQASQVSSFPLGAELAGVRVTITKGDTAVSAFPVFVSAGQVNAILPSNAPLGLVTLRVIFNGEPSNPTTVRIVAHNPGIFTANQFGIGPGIVQNFVSQAETPLNSTALAAQPNQLVTIWLTGMGAIAAPDNEAPPVASLPYDVEVFVGGVKANQIIYAGRTPCCSAVDQINVFIPENAPTGCFVPLTVRVNGVVSNTTTLAIGEEGGACADAHNPFSEALVRGGKQGSLVLLRQAFSDMTVPARPFEHTIDQFYASFSSQPGGPFAFDPYASLPPPGSCTAFTVQGDLLKDASVPATASTGLSSGALSITTPTGSTGAMAIPSGMNLHAALLGHTVQLADAAQIPLKLDSGTATISAQAGAGVGAFQAQAAVAAPVTWSNRAALGSVDRAAGVTFNWSGNAQVILGGVSVDLPSNSSGVFTCVAPAGASTFTVPDYVLANLPASRATRNRTRSYLLLLSIPQGQPSAFTAEGLDYGGAVSVHAQMQGVVIR